MAKCNRLTVVGDADLDGVYRRIGLPSVFPEHRPRLPSAHYRLIEPSCHVERVCQVIKNKLCCGQSWMVISDEEVTIKTDAEFLIWGELRCSRVIEKLQLPSLSKFVISIE